MRDPIEYRVVRSLQEALRGIRRPDGYYHDVLAVAVKLDPDVDVTALVDPLGPRPFVVLVVRPDDWAYQPASQITIDLPVTVHWYHDVVSPVDALVDQPQPITDDDRMQAYFRGVADIERAVTQDLSRGGLATDTRLTERLFADDVASTMVHASVDLRMRLHRTYGQPAGA